MVDCAHGATYHIAPNVFRELGAEVIVIGAAPNGININHEVGATSMGKIRETVIAEKADLGIALDGDGDRIMMVNRHGKVIDGDEILYVLACDAQDRGILQGGVVGTLMSNLGLELALKARDIPFARSKVGDRYVMELLKKNAWRIGGENSGHILNLDHGTTGDGIVAGILVLAAMCRKKATLEELTEGIKMLPQVLVNVRFEGKHNPLAAESVLAAQAEVEKQLGERGRVLLRKSGTEPLIRVMVEGDIASDVTHHANVIADAIRALV